jgi:ABC-type branched-subunit amino acid transport system ATPase component
MLSTVQEDAVLEDAVLAAVGLDAGYHGHPVVRGVDLFVRAGEVVALLGANGAGKTTTLLALAGELKPIAGEVWFDGKPTTSPLHRRARHGLGFITEERSVFPALSVRENLSVGRCDQDHALRLFPELKALLGRRAGLLSGGEQQMLTLARALARQPKVLIADELSLGLAPLAVARLHEALRHAADDDGIAVLMVEQHVRQALRVSDRAYLLRRGEIVIEGSAAELAANDSVLRESYLATH